MDQAIRKIMEAGIKAPSGDNCQPWKFKVVGETIQVFNIPDRDTSLYSWGQLSSFFAHGALIENMKVAAPTFGYRTVVDLFPDKNDKNFVASVRLEKTAISEDPLYSCIDLRCTNRKPYENIPLTKEQREYLLRDNGRESEDIRIMLVEDEESRKKLAWAASMNEVVLLENKPMHDFFFGHINWTKDEDKKKSVGFYIETLELPPPAKVAFKIFRYWPAMKFFNLLKFSRFVAKENSKIYSSGSAIGAIVVRTKGHTDFVKSGTVFERLWLKAVKSGLNLQPLAGIVFLMNRVSNKDIGQLSRSHVELISKAYNTIAEVFGVKNNTIVMMFRIGPGDNPTARSSRLLPVIFD